ncbi:hypothetical protein CRE_19820 [Caenorhabditis remanei]|uniref:Receptor L-domain domain-containing protein n=1 Tax=Caenorhabditis remanei TaxID=31234 RepID=E3MTG4_CAERE|nr:hypothetical protein CRE_19820 [Caenorhabditis remanei]
MHSLPSVFTMKLFHFFIFSFIFYSSAILDPPDALQKVLYSYEYGNHLPFNSKLFFNSKLLFYADPKCVFNYTQINSKTIQFFPKCDMVFGILVFNENTDLTSAEIKKSLKTMSVLVGGMIVENSNFTDLSFFTVPEGDYGISIYCEMYGVYILNNKNLINPGSLSDAFMIGNEKGNECDFWIENNTRLDMDKYCDTGYFYYYMEMTIRGNLQDCGCPGNQIFEHYIDEYQNCSVLTNGLYLNYFYTSFSLHGLSNIQLVKGKINIQKIPIQNLSFLKNLTTLKIRNLGIREKIVFNIQDNLKLTRFEMPSLETIENVEDAGIRLFNFENLHPEFCLTIRELIWFLEQEVSFLNLHATICNDSMEIELCHFESMSKLAENCNIILGDLFIGSGDETYINKLEAVNYLFGSLIIRGTNLENLNFLSNLKYIAYLGSGVDSDPKPVIQLLSNKNLRNAELNGVSNVLVSSAPSDSFFENSLSKPMNIIRKTPRTAVIQDNHPDIFQHLNGSCNLINTEDEVLKYRTALNYIGGNCDPLCVFKHSEVTSKTIKSFPNCSMAYGISVFNQKTDLKF